MTYEMEMECNFGLTEIATKESLRTVTLRVMEFITSLPITKDMKVNGKIVNIMDRAFFIGQMEMFIKDLLKTI